MKKSSKILGSMAVSAALVMGTAVPAFAVELDAGDPATPSVSADNALTSQGKATQFEAISEDDESNFKGVGETDPTGASTIVKVSTYTSQISVTVPLSLPVALDTAGGVGYAPTNYYIQNNSSIDVNVASATYAINDDLKGEWSFGTTGMLNGTSTSMTKVDGKNPGTGSFAVKIAPKDDADAAALQLVGTTQAPQSGSGTLGWTVTAKPADQATDDTTNQLALAVDAYSSTLSKSIAAKTANDAAGIIYTVKAAS